MKRLSHKEDETSSAASETKNETRMKQEVKLGLKPDVKCKSTE